MDLRARWSLLRKTFSLWDDNDAPRMGAALAFYTILSLAPLVILIVALTARLFGQAVSQDRLLAEIGRVIGYEGLVVVRGMVENIQKTGKSSVASAFGTLTLMFGASGVFTELRWSLNRIWGVRPTTNGGIMATVKERLFSFGMVLAVGFLLLVSLVTSAGLAALGKFFSDFLPAPEAVLTTVNFLISLLVTAVLFGLIFRYVPAMKFAWADIWKGALVTALLFTIGKSVIALYLGKAAIGSAYGAAGSLVVLTVWVYYSSMIFLFGAQLTQVLTTGGSGSEPDPD